MLYEFKSKAAGAGTVVMLQPIAERLLGIIGKEPAEAGLFEPDHLPAAIQTLEAAIAQERASASPNADDEEDLPPGAPRRVSLAQRAWPLLELFRTAHAARKRVTWGL